MSVKSELMTGGTAIAAQRPWSRAVVGADAWRKAGWMLGEGKATLLGLWSDGVAVHLCLCEEPLVEPFVLSFLCVDGEFPSVALNHAPADRLERAICDLHGFRAEDAPDTRPWLDHGRWGVRHPLGDRGKAATDGVKYRFLPAEGPPLHQIPVGPVHAGIIEPGHFRFSANGETVVRLEERLGYVHKGIEQLLIGVPLDRAARLAGRVSGDSTVAYATAFARAVEAALEIDVPQRARSLRVIMAELERLANHFGDIGAICNDASFSLMHAHCGALRERVLRCAQACFGHRLMMDRVVPGGVSQDLGAGSVGALKQLVEDVRRHFPELVDLYDNTASLQDRTVTTGILNPDLARRFGASGYIGRASGRRCDARRWPGYAPYTKLNFESPVRREGDVDARVWIRIEEVRQSVSLIEQCANALSSDPIRALFPTSKATAEEREGIALVEGFRGDILAWVRIGKDGSVASCHLRDPSWFQWPLLEAAIEGNIVADFPLCNKSFNCSYSGHDM
ncbi:MAG: hydrogenase expression protein HypE [Hyphomicrobiaceae bacterium]|nr:MAG: hydrogenase expression protein HypE [Hyphomicrobiaceae bacterium]